MFVHIFLGVGYWVKEYECFMACDIYYNSLIFWKVTLYQSW